MVALLFVLSSDDVVLCPRTFFYVVVGLLVSVVFHVWRRFTKER